MSKRKPSFRVDQVLPDDDHLGQRSSVWRTHMDKYSKKSDSKEIDISDAANALDYDLSDDSLISDVEESAGEEDSDQENREELNKQLKQVVNRRKPVWQRSGLQKIMASIEDPSQQFNMLSHEKVENWLLNRSAGSLAREISQGQETTIMETTEDGDRMKFHRKQHMTVSTKDDEDSLYSVDTAKYILSNKGKNSRSSVKTVYKQVIKHYTMISGTNGATHPKLHSISNFPIIPEEQLALPATQVDLRHKSDSAIDTGAGTSTEQILKLANDRISSKSSSNRATASRKKVFKKTMKKKPTAKERSVTPPKSRTVSKSPPAEVYERALKNGAKVKKIPVETRPTKPTAKNRRIHWKETSISGRSATRGSSQNSSSSSSSEDEDNNEVFTRAKSRQKTPPKRETRRRPTRRNNPSSNSESSPTKQPTSPRRSTKQRQTRSKNLDKDLVAPFEAITLSPRKRLDQTTTNPIDQTTNMTALFSGANEKITNSTEINATSTSIVGPGATSFANSTTASTKAARIPGFPDQSRCLVVYEPREIRSELPPNAQIRIQMADLNLAGVTKPRHLEKFAKFSYLIHPNSSVRFFPSDSEDDEPAPVAPVSVNSSDEDISYDDDDPILTYNPRFTDRLNVVEVRHD